MTKESQVKSKQTEQKPYPKRTEQILATKQSEASGLFLSSTIVADNGLVESQAAMLRRIDQSQRQNTLAQIGKLQGNRYVQRLVTAMHQKPIKEDNSESRKGISNVTQQPVGASVAQKTDAIDVSAEQEILIDQHRQNPTEGQSMYTSNQPAAGVAQRDEERPTFEFFALADVITAKRNMERRLDDMSEYAMIAMRVGDTIRNKLLAYSATYRLAYADYAQAIRSARQEAQNQNMWLGICVGVGMNVAAAFILPSTAAGWFALTASEAATALASGAGQAVAGATLSSLLQFSGGDLEPGGLSPEAQELPVWRQASFLYRAAARQVQTIQNLSRIVSGAEFLIGEIRVQVSGGLQTMTEEQALDRVQALIFADQNMARVHDGTLAQSLSDLRAFEAQVKAINPESYSQQRMEQDIWILWMSTLTNASVLDLDAIEDRLHAIHVLGPNSRLGIDFDAYTFWFEEDEARDAARGEASNIRQQMRAMQPQSPAGT